MFLSAFFKFFIRDFGIYIRARNIYIYYIPLFKKYDISAACGFRAYMSDRSAPACTAESPVSYQRNGLVKFHACKRTRRIEHLSHSRTAFRSLVAYNNDISVPDPAVIYRCDRILFTVKNSCRA